MNDINILSIMALMLVHFIADFALQSDWMAINKNSNWKAMGAHIAIYTTCLMVFGFAYALLNGFVHLFVDINTSRATKILWQQNKRHWFFVVIGLDQMIHYWCLILTWNLV